VSILIIHRNPLEPFPYLQWLADLGEDVVVLAAADRLAPFGEQVPDGDLGYARLEFLDRFEDEPLLARARELAAEFGVRQVLAHHEADVGIAARLREELGLPGAWSDDVRPFRDKALMKRLVEAAGVPVAPHAVARTRAEVEAFAERHGLPVVLKDRAGYNAVGLRIVRDAAALAACLDDAYPGGPRDDLLVEAFVPGRMCHVDGLVVAGRTVLAWPSQYQYDLASFGSDHGPRVDLTLDPDDPLTDRLLQLTDTVLGALRPAGSRLTDHAFHAEIFHTPDDRLVLCEIAARPGGAKIKEVFETLFGVHLGEYTTRAQVGLPLPALAALGSPGSSPGATGVLPRPARMAGQLLMMKRPGRVAALPPTPPEPWVDRFWLYARPGQVIPSASGSADFLTAVVGSAPTRAECERRLRSLGARLAAQTDIRAAS